VSSIKKLAYSNTPAGRQGFKIAELKTFAKKYFHVENPVCGLQKTLFIKVSILSLVYLLKMAGKFNIRKAWKE